MVSLAVCGIEAAWMNLRRESRVATPVRSMLAGRILIMSLVAEASAGTSRSFS
jgi:hypothetical protein